MFIQKIIHVYKKVFFSYVSFITLYYCYLGVEAVGIIVGGAVAAAVATTGH